MKSDSSLYNACRNGNYKEALNFIEAGVKVDEQSGESGTALHAFMYSYGATSQNRD